MLLPPLNNKDIETLISRFEDKKTLFIYFEAFI
jgi:hypothetical protein